MAGRPSKYNPKSTPKIAYAMALAGRTDKQISEYLEISESTLNKWKLDYPVFLESLKSGKEEPDNLVERSLFERATGYVNKNAVKIFMPANAEEPVYAPYHEHVAPDVTAQIFWLKNRRPDRWRDKQDIDFKGSMMVKQDLSKLTDEELATLETILSKTE
jgi:hypothetical protein